MASVHLAKDCKEVVTSCLPVGSIQQITIYVQWLHLQQQRLVYHPDATTWQHAISNEVRIQSFVSWTSILAYLWGSTLPREYFCTLWCSRSSEGYWGWWRQVISFIRICPRYCDTLWCLTAVAFLSAKVNAPNFQSFARKLGMNYSSWWTYSSFSAVKGSVESDCCHCWSTAILCCKSAPLIWCWAGK